MIKIWKTNIGFFTLVTFLLIVQIQIPSVRCEEDAETEESNGDETSEQTCKKTVFNLIQGVVTASLNCLGGKLPLRSPFELTTRFYCIVKCSMMELGVIGADGILDEVQALFYFQEVIPETIRENVLEGVQPCLGMASEFQPKQYYCQSYAPFVQCTIRSLLQTLTPYILDCFTSPGLGFFFNFIDLIVPRPNPSSAAVNEVRRRYASSRLQFSRTHPNNPYSNANSNILKVNSQFSNSSTIISRKRGNTTTTNRPIGWRSSSNFT